MGDNLVSGFSVEISTMPIINSFLNELKTGPPLIAQGTC